MKYQPIISLFFMIPICLSSSAFSAPVPIETYTGTQSLTLPMPGTQIGDSIRFKGILKYQSLFFTQGAVAYQDTSIEFATNEFAFMLADYNIVLTFPNQPGTTVDALGTWKVTEPGVVFDGVLEWQGVHLGASFSASSFDIVPTSSFSSLVSKVLWSSVVVPVLNGNIVSIDGNHTVTGVSPAGGTANMNMTATGTIYAEPDVSGADIPQALPAVALGQNYPNPFNPCTTIFFTLPKAAAVELSIFDLGGKHVVNLVNRVVDAGPNEFQWQGTDSAGNAVGSGVYVYRLRTANTVLAKTMLLVK